MSKNIDKLLEAEAEYAEAHKDAPERPGTIATRPGGQRARIYSLRLSDAEYAALEAASTRAGVAASTLARTWITERLAADDGTTDLHALADTLALVSKRLDALANA